MTQKRLNFFLAVTAIALLTDIVHTFPSKRYYQDLMTRQNAVDTPERNMYRFLKQMELEQTLLSQYSSVSPTNSEIVDLGIETGPEITPEKELQTLEMALEQQSIVDARSYYGEQPNIYRDINPILRKGVIFVPEEDEAVATRQGFDVIEDDFLDRAVDNQERMGDDLENIGGYDGLGRSEDLREMIHEEIQQKSIFREVDSLRQQELLEQAIRQEEMLQDITMREASSLRYVSPLRENAESDPLQKFQIARDAFIYKEEIRQNALQQQALRQEMLRQEALRQEKVFEEDPERQGTTLRQESEILEQLIRQEELRQENSRNLEDAYREEAAIKQNDPETEQMLLQKAQYQESIRQESQERQEEAVRQNDILRKKISKILQQVCINCGPKIVSVSHSQNIQI